LLVCGLSVRWGINLNFSEDYRWPASAICRFCIPFGREEAELDFRFLNI